MTAFRSRLAQIPALLRNRLFLVLVIPALVIATIPVFVLLYDATFEVRRSIDEALQFHAAACAERIEGSLSRHRSLLWAVSGQTDIRLIMQFPERVNPDRIPSAQTLIENEARAARLPGVEATFMEYDGQIRFQPPLPPDSELASADMAMELLGPEPNAGTSLGFRFSRPFEWAGGIRCVAAVLTFPRSNGAGTFGYVVSLANMRASTVDLASDLSDVTSVMIIDRESCEPWFTSAVPLSVSLSDGSVLTDELLYGRLAESRAVEVLRPETGPTSFISVHPLKTPNLVVGIAYNDRGRAGWIGSVRVLTFLVLGLLWIAVLMYAFMSHRSHRSRMADVGVALQSYVLTGEIPEPRSDEPTDVTEVMEALRSFTSELDKKESITREQTRRLEEQVAAGRRIIQSLPYGYVRVTPAGELLEYNSELLRLCNCSSEEMLSKSFNDLLLEPDRTDRDDLEHTQVPAAEFQLWRSDGEYLPVAAYRRSLRIGNSQEIVWIIRDISREVEIRSALMERTSGLESSAATAAQEIEGLRSGHRELLAHLHEAVLRTDDSGVIVDSNPAAIRLFGFPAREEMLGIGIFEHLKLSSDSADLTERFATEDPLREVQVRYRRFDGAEGVASMTRRRSELRGRTTVDVLLMDLSEPENLKKQLATIERELKKLSRTHEEEVRKTQDQLIDRARKAGMAEVASELLHNIGNTINSIGVRLQTILDGVVSSDTIGRVKKLTELLERQGDDRQKVAQACAYIKLIQNVLSDSRKQQDEHLNFISEKLGHISEMISVARAHASVRGLIEEVDMAAVLSDAVEMYRGSLAKRGINTRFQFASVPKIRVEKNKILQVLLNLMKNAIDAVDMGSGERREIVLDLRYDEAQQRVRIAISDTGVGISDEVRKNLFSFGYTTKKNSGTGIGLHSSFNLMKDMGGSITAESDGPMLGATFTVSLPPAPPSRSR